VNLHVLYLASNNISNICDLNELVELSYVDLLTNPLNENDYNICIPLIIESYPGIELLYDPIPSNVDISPHSLNLTSKGKWITCKITIDEKFKSAPIDESSIYLEEEIQAEHVHISRKNNTASMKFDRSKIIDLLSSLEDIGDVELFVTGQLENGVMFEGSDSIKAMSKRRGM
jgi:hypothetical protein